ncbi:MAG: hypothetical protein IK111_01435 [Lachnospiraceae bacterium]|nr:hypothetical protein [Lachnospiraceae bacterium]
MNKKFFISTFAISVLLMVHITTPVPAAAASTATTLAVPASVSPAAPEKVTVDLIIFAGQSNMSGNGGNAAMAPVVPSGQGYEYRPMAAPNTIFPALEPFGKYEKGLISDAPGYQNGSLVSSFMITYYSKTGTPVVGVPATRGGSDSGFWANPATKAELLSRYIKAKAYLESNNYNVRHRYLVFLQGETEAVRGVNEFEYKNNLTSAFQPLFANGLEQVFMITPGYAKDGVYSYDAVVKAQLDLCSSNNLFAVASTALHSPAMNGYLADGVHYNQQGLNAVGSNAGATVGAYANGGR